jgi:hypothetical protein
MFVVLLPEPRQRIAHERIVIRQHHDERPARVTARELPAVGNRGVARRADVPHPGIDESLGHLTRVVVRTVVRYDDFEIRNALRKH